MLIACASIVRRIVAPVIQAARHITRHRMVGLFRRHRLHRVIRATGLANTRALQTACRTIPSFLTAGLLAIPQPPTAKLILPPPATTIAGPIASGTAPDVSAVADLPPPATPALGTPPFSTAASEGRGGATLLFSSPPKITDFPPPNQRLKAYLPDPTQTPVILTPSVTTPALPEPNTAVIMLVAIGSLIIVRNHPQDRKQVMATTN